MKNIIIILLISTLFPSCFLTFYTEEPYYRLTKIVKAEKAKEEKIQFEKDRKEKERIQFEKDRKKIEEDQRKLAVSEFKKTKKKFKSIGYKGYVQYRQFDDFLYDLQNGKIYNLNSYKEYVFDIMYGSTMLKVFQVTDKYVFYKYHYDYRIDTIIAIPRVKNMIYMNGTPFKVSKYNVFIGVLEYKTVIGSINQALIFKPIYQG